MEHSGNLRWLLILLLLLLMVISPVFLELGRDLFTADTGPESTVLLQKGYLLQPLCWVEMGQLAQAEEWLGERLERDSADAEAWGIMGLCHERQGHLDEALQDFQRSLDLLPQAVFRDMARLGLVRVFELTGQTSEAWNQLRLHLRENPGSEAGLKTGLRIAREEGNLEQERDYLLRLINHSAGGETEIAEWRRRLTEIENAG